MDGNGHFIHFASPRPAFDLDSLAFHTKICVIQATFTMKDANNDTGLYT